MAQQLRTVAGNNSRGYTGDSGQATFAAIGATWGITTDKKGNLFIADDDVNVVRRVAPDGTITTYAGTGCPGYTGDSAAATAARLNYPTGLATDSQGNLYIADNGNFAIRRVDTNGIITTIAGDQSGRRGYSGDGGPATAALLEGCVAIAFDKYDNMYIADGNTRVRKVNHYGTISTIAGNGTAGYSGDGDPATTAALYNPCGIVADTNGNIYIADQQNNVIRRVNKAGTISTFAGNHLNGYSGDGGPATAARLNTPGGLTIDGEGCIYLADQGNNRIRKINQAGTISTLAGNGSYSYSGNNGPAAAGSFKYPSAVCYNSSGNLFVADRNNFAVRQVVNPAAATITAHPGNTIVAGTPVTFSVPQGGSNFGLVYQWYINGHAAGTHTDTLYVPVISNNDVITCQLTDPALNHAFAASDSLVMKVTPLTIPAMITEEQIINVQLYPNPNNGWFEFSGTVKSPVDEYVFYGVFDMAGHMVSQGNTYSYQGKVQHKTGISNLPAGRYTLLVSIPKASSLIAFEVTE
jgi:sugar lactone lactonase YvrE